MPASLTEFEIYSFISLDIIALIELTLVLEINVFLFARLCLCLSGLFRKHFPNDTLECYRTSQEEVQSLKMFRDQLFHHIK